MAQYDNISSVGQAQTSVTEGQQCPGCGCRIRKQRRREAHLLVCPSPSADPARIAEFVNFCGQIRQCGGCKRFLLLEQHQEHKSNCRIPSSYLLSAQGQGFCPGCEQYIDSSKRAKHLLTCRKPADDVLRIQKFAGPVTQCKRCGRFISVWDSIEHKTTCKQLPVSLPVPRYVSQDDGPSCERCGVKLNRKNVERHKLVCPKMQNLTATGLDRERVPAPRSNPKPEIAPQDPWAWDMTTPNTSFWRRGRRR